MLRAVIELPLPSPAQQPRSNATGARKRKCESPPPALVALEERLDAAEAERKVARKALTRAESAQEAAEKAEATKERVADRMIKKANALPARSTVGFAKMMRIVQAAFSGWQRARLAARDAEIARLQAYIR